MSDAALTPFHIKKEFQVVKILRLQTEPIDYTALTEAVRTRGSGAVVLFLGTVRDLTGAQRTVALEYEAYAALAEKEAERLVAQACLRWPLQGVGLIHRLGRLAVGEVSVAVAVSCPHRAEAFAAGQFLIDELKKSVPIWKRECFADGTAAWTENRT
jgi:molybdopterin synthase catalytic subunit